MYKSVNKTTVIRRYMEALALHTGAPKVHWEDNFFIFLLLRLKELLLELNTLIFQSIFYKINLTNGLFLPKYEKSSVMPADVCTKSCSGPIIIRSTKCMTGLRFYPTSETEHYQFMILHEFIVK